MSNSIGIVILAAGKGTRMKVDAPKALASALGRPLLDYVVDASHEFAKKCDLQAEIGVVIGHRKELLEEWWNQHSHKASMKLAIQKQQNGTADALKACFTDYPHFWDHTYTLVACADTPLLTSEEFKKLFDLFKADSSLVAVAATFEAHDPKGYGRILAADKGFRIIEEKDASENERLITEVNSGVYIAKTSHVKEVLSTITNKNKSGEFYLTDLFSTNYPVKNIKFSSGVPFLGINTMEQLSDVNRILKDQKIQSLMVNGVQFLNSESTYIESNVSISAGTIIYPAVTITGKTTIGSNVLIESGCFIKNSQIHDEAQILAHSCLEEAIVHSSASIGPMARLRPGSEIGPDAKIGNFVEIKKAKLAKGAKVSHLSYVGDAEIGENSNIGCGFITCNYDGANKHKTKIGKNTFIGSDVQIIAPLEVGDDAFVAAGSTITKNIPSGAFGITRAQQIIKEGAAKRFLKTKKS